MQIEDALKRDELVLDPLSLFEEGRSKTRDVGLGRPKSPIPH
jgi:hypothetical protein